MKRRPRPQILDPSEDHQAEHGAPELADFKQPVPHVAEVAKDLNRAVFDTDPGELQPIVDWLERWIKKAPREMAVAIHYLVNDVTAGDVINFQDR